MRRTLLVAMAMSISPVALAHHGWSGYDMSKALKLTGKVLESGYEHPHGQLRFAGPGKTWNVVLAPPSRMERRGLDKARLRPGATLTVEGYANRDRPGEMRAERVTIDGRTIELR